MSKDDPSSQRPRKLLRKTRFAFCALALLAIYYALVYAIYLGLGWMGRYLNV